MENDKKSDSKCSTGIWWWATLVIAVLAVPAFASVVATIGPIRGIGQIAVFILACWLCTYLGMKLMQNPRMYHKIGGDKKD